MASDGEHVYAATSDVVVTRTATSRTLDPKAGGGLTALRIADGSARLARGAAPVRRAAALQPGAVGRPDRDRGVVFSGSLDGHLRAYTAATGAVIWDFDTARAFETVNGVKASGGAIDGPGAVSSTGWCS